MTRCLAILIALLPTVASGQVVYYYDAQCWGGGCPQQYYYQQPQCPPQQYQQRPRRGPAPDGVETQPAEPDFKPLPSPPPVQTPPMESKPIQPAVPPPTLPPVEIESKLVPIRNRADEAHARIDALEKQLNARIETIAQMQVVVNNDVKQIQQAVTPNYDAIAAEVAKRLTHSATITLLDGTQKKQVKPLNEPLNFVQHSRGVK